MNKLLLSTGTTIGICFGVGILVLVIIIFIFKKHENTSLDNSGSVQMNLELKPKYMVKKQLKFYYLLHKILPKEYIAFPNVGVDNLCTPLGNRVGYNKILSKYVDFAIFEEATMKPVAVIDVFDMSYGDEAIEEFEPEVVEALKAINLPLVQFLIKDEFDEQEIKKKIMGAIAPEQSLEK